MAKRYYNNTEELAKQCQQVIIERNHPVDVVELWKPCYLNDREKKRETHIDVLRTDGYYDHIYFKIGDEKLADEVYEELKKFNREITPLEKYHASF